MANHGNLGRGTARQFGFQFGQYLRRLRRQFIAAADEIDRVRHRLRRTRGKHCRVALANFCRIFDARVDRARRADPRPGVGGGEGLFAGRRFHQYLADLAVLVGQKHHAIGRRFTLIEPGEEGDGGNTQ